MFPQAWHTFFHSRVGDDACVLGGCLRICFGLIFLYDRLILGMDLQDFFTPKHGALPLHVGRDNENLGPSMPTLFEYYEESDTFMWFLYGLGQVQATLFVLGVCPRFQLACLFVNILSFQNHNFLFWDEQDVLFRIWGFLLLFCPLHRITIYDLFKSPEYKHVDSWPIWPFRLFQIQLTLMYMSLSLHKLQCEEWQTGEALYWIQDSLGFAAGSWVTLPDVILNRMMPIQILSWLVVGLELASWITLWVPGLKWSTAFCMIAFNLVTELTMNLHCMPWLAILGWSATLFKESNVEHAKDRLPAHSHGVYPHSSNVVQTVSDFMHQFRPEICFVTDLLLASGLVLLLIDTLPIAALEDLIFSAPSALSKYQQALYAVIDPTLCVLGLWQGPWNLHGGDMASYHKLSYSAYLYRYHLPSDETDEEYIEAEHYTFPVPADASTMWERKRYARQWIYFSHLNDKQASGAWVSLGEAISDQQYRTPSSKQNKENSDTVMGLEMVVHWEGSLEPRAPMWSWDVPARDENTKFTSWTSLMKVRYCTDIIPSEEKFPDLFCNDCWSDEEFVNTHCRAQCEVCVSHYAEFGHDYLSYPLSAYTSDDCVSEGDKDWDTEDCPYYTYYRDFDLYLPRDGTTSLDFHRQHFSDAEVVLLDSADGEVQVTYKNQNNQTAIASTQKVPRRGTVLKSA